MQIRKTQGNLWARGGDMESSSGSMIEMIIWKNIPELKKRLRSARQNIERGGVIYLVLHSVTDRPRSEDLHGQESLVSDLSFVVLRLRNQRPKHQGLPVYIILWGQSVRLLYRLSVIWLPFLCSWRRLLWPALLRSSWSSCTVASEAPFWCT